MYADRFRLAPQGLFGGFDGTCARCRVERDGETIDVPSKGAMKLMKGDIVTVDTGGGAGYGDPAERDREAIAEELADGWISDEAARRDYGWRDAAE
jgi:N-methylhydantoinase B